MQDSRVGSFVGSGLFVFAAVIALSAPFVSGCTDDDKRVGSDSRFEDLSPLIAREESTYAQEALGYLRSAFDTLSNRHVYGPDYDWEELWLATLERTGGASTRAQTHEAIRFALRDLDDPHSRFTPPRREAPPRDTSRASKQRELSFAAGEARMLGDDIAYIEIPRFAWTDSLLAGHYASNIQDLIRRLDAENPCGWILDLRRNSGGNMWPMLAGIGPLLGGEHIGAFVDRLGDASRWHYRDGKVRYDGQVMAEAAGSAYSLRRRLPPIAVLISDRTASSAEAVAVALRGRPNTRFFGRTTAGAATAHRSFRLADGAWIRYSHAYFADRRDSVYEGSVEPDVRVDTTMWEDERVARGRAAAWLKTTASCS